MEDINFIPESPSTPPRRQRPFFLFRRFFLPLAALTILGGILFSAKKEGAAPASHPSLLTTFRRIVSTDKALLGEGEDRINFVLLGIGGAGHEGPELTDTIMFASVRPSTKEVGMLSVPRDLLVPIEGYGWRKINHVNAYGEEQKRGAGAQLAANTLGEILDQPIHYWVKVDFSGFEKFIDAIGGVRIHVDRSFTDPAYPIGDKEGAVTSLAFEKGWQTMDGKTALQFVRSRHGDNNEGTDFARAARQQKVILAVKKEVLSAATLLNPVRINRLLDTLDEHVDTNLTTFEILRLGNIADFLDAQSVSTAVLDTSPQSPLYESTANGAYVILPKGQDWSALARVGKDVFNAEEILSKAPTVTPRGVRIEIQNATEVQGLASVVAELLAAQGFEIATIGNAVAPSDRTTIYDFTDGRAEAELKLLTESLTGSVSLSASGWLRTHDPLPMEVRSDDRAATMVRGSDVDVLIVLGNDNNRLGSDVP